MVSSRLEFRILGPLVVRADGLPVPVGGPKQRALLALLLLSANRVVSRERLVGELFADQSVNSADHALRNQVSRLRKALSAASGDEPRLVARAPGYLLRVEPGELDLERFERLVTEARELLVSGKPAPAAESLRAAERLWEGRPLADLEFEPFARIEVERLEELRLAAVEERIDAELALGLQLALVSELEALAAEHPFRERFPAQLMLALYRCGRQAEGLEVYRRTRKRLNDELGLEPSVELQELERAILVQDPALIGVTPRHTRAAPRDVCPFKGLAPFDSDDAEFFFGRERLIDELVARLAAAPLLAIIGASGSGKSSLMHAGLLPALDRWPQVLIRPGERSAAELAHVFERVAQGERLVVAVDQFEELFAPSVTEVERRAFVDVLVEAAWDPDRRPVILLALRADFFGRLAPYVELADLLGSNQVLLGPMTPGELRRAIEGPAERTGLEVEPALVDTLVDDVAGAPGGLPLLSTALLDLWHERQEGALTLAGYERTGGVRGAVGRYAESAFLSLDDDDRLIARRIALRLVAGGDGEALTRRRVSRAELDADDDESIARVSAALVARRLLVVDDESVEFVHEALLDQWPRLVGWLEEDAQGRRLHRHLTQASVEWEASGRDPGELYRGPRLAAALEWADQTADESPLNRLEREFLQESRSAFAREAGRERRANRRLRGLLAVALALLVAVAAAAFVATREWGTARTQATAATAQRLGAQALDEPLLDRSLLLAREGVALDDSLATRSNLLAALVRSPAALAVLHGGGTRVLDDALSPDGRTLAVGGNDGSVTFFDTRTLREERPRFASTGQIANFGGIARPVRALAFSPDGRTLAVGDSTGHVATLALVDALSHRARTTVTAPTRGNAVTADVLFSPDGHAIVTGEAVPGPQSPPAEVLVLRRRSDGRALRASQPIPTGALIGYTTDRRFLLVTSGETTSYLLDPETFRRIRTYRIGGAAALSPTSDTAAFGRSDGNVELLDLRTGTERSMTRRASGSVAAVAFSADGRVLATASDDGSVDVWDVPTASLRETFDGHAAAALGLQFSPDGATLYSGSSDGSVIVWDVRGDRRLGQPFRFAPTPAAGEGPQTPPTQGAATAVAASPDSTHFATSPGPNRVTLWRSRDLAVVAELRGPCGDISSLAYSHDGRLLAATGNGRATVVWNVTTGKIVRRLGPSGARGNLGVAISVDDRLVATAGVDSVLRIYSLQTGRRIAAVRGDGTLQDLDFNSNGKLLAAAGQGEHILIWNVKERALERTIKQNALILTLRFSPDGRTIATGDLSGDVNFWDAASGRKIGRTLGDQNGYVISVSYNPTGTELVTTSTDGKFRLWDLASGKLIGAPLPGGDTGGWGGYFPNGKKVIAVYPSGIGLIWNADPAAWNAHACHVANRNLTPTEWHDFLAQRNYRSVCP